MHLVHATIFYILNTHNTHSRKEENTSSCQLNCVNNKQNVVQYDMCQLRIEIRSFSRFFFFFFFPYSSLPHNSIINIDWFENMVLISVRILWFLWLSKRKKKLAVLAILLICIRGLTTEQNGCS